MDLIDFENEANESKPLGGLNKTSIFLEEKIANLERNQNLLLQALEILSLEPVGMPSSANIMTPIRAPETNEWAAIEQLKVSLDALRAKMDRLWAAVEFLAESAEQGFNTIEQGLKNHT